MPYPTTRATDDDGIDPVKLKNFDPKTFWPTLNDRYQSDSLSIYNTSSHPRRPSITPSYDDIPISPKTKIHFADGYPSESFLRRERQRNRLRIWMISICFFVILCVLVALLAWLGVHNWFKHNDKSGPMMDN
ncbi:hypothetical protein MMC21_000814 [Puttea exsequens]|nr:hypothetical protein [Puttea exsequens]